MMLLVSGVHPFATGNGCLARVMMNAELVAADELRIAIPAILRGEYLSALAAASRQRSFQPICSVLDRARRWTSEVDFRTWVSAERDATRTNALLDSIASDKTNVKLILPSALEPVAG
jgi:Fic family protein